MIQVRREQDHLFRGFGSTQKRKRIPGVAALVLVEAMLLQVIRQALGQRIGQWSALDVAAVLSRSFKTKGLEERSGVKGGQMLVASARAASMQLVAGQKIQIGVNTSRANLHGSVLLGKTGVS